MKKKFSARFCASPHPPYYKLLMSVLFCLLMSGKLMLINNLRGPSQDFDQTFSFFFFFDKSLHKAFENTPEKNYCHTTATTCATSYQTK